MDLSKIFTWIKSHKWKTALLGICLFLAPLFIVHLLYKWATPYYILQSDWDSGDIVTYIAGFEAFVGTVFLGAVAADQNKRSIDINDRLLLIEEVNSRFQRCPNIKAEAISVTETTFNGIKDPETILFCSRNVSKQLSTTSDLFTQQFNRFTFKIKNLSDFNTTVKLESLTMTAYGEDSEPFQFDPIPIGIQSECYVVASKQELEYNFIVYDTELNNEEIFFAKTTIIVTNNINDRYKLEIEFFIIITIDRHLFRVATEKITLIR